jgi:hypothetical protein
VYIHRGEDLSTHEVKKTGSLGLTTAPSTRSSLMKYLSTTTRDNLVLNCYTYIGGEGIGFF